jgi:hypothetical protein
VRGSRKPDCVVNLAYLYGARKIVEQSLPESRNIAGEADRADCGRDGKEVGWEIGRSGSNVRSPRRMVSGRKRLVGSWSRFEYSAHLWDLLVDPVVAVAVFLHIKHNS